MQGIALALIRGVQNSPSAGAQTQTLLSPKRGFRQSSPLRANLLSSQAWSLEPSPARKRQYTQ